MTGRAYFVTGTDTGVGKTRIATGLLDAARRAGLRTVGLKPVAAGIDGESGGHDFNADALALRDAATIELDYPSVNPFLLRRPIAPHIAAALEGRSTSVADLVTHCRRLLDEPFDLAVIEGAGGWLVPLNERETLADVCAELEVPVILVVAMRLGCLNHALLTAAAIRSAGLSLAAWVANCPDSMDVADENVAALVDRLDAPLLGRVPRLADDASAADHLDLGALADD